MFTTKKGWKKACERLSHQLDIRIPRTSHAIHSRAWRCTTNETETERKKKKTERAIQLPAYTAPATETDRGPCILREGRREVYAQDNERKPHLLAPNLAHPYLVRTLNCPYTYRGVYKITLLTSLGTVYSQCTCTRIYFPCVKTERKARPCAYII